jgi:hypothetical protein
LKKLVSAIGELRRASVGTALACAGVIALLGCNVLGDSSAGIFIINESGRDVVVETAADDVREQFPIASGVTASLATGATKSTDNRVLLFDRDCNFVAQITVPGFDYHHFVKIDANLTLQVGEWSGGTPTTFVERPLALPCPHS